MKKPNALKANIIQSRRTGIMKIINWLFPTGWFFAAVWGALFWLCLHWSFIPDWAPTPGSGIMFYVDYLGSFFVNAYIAASLPVLIWVISASAINVSLRRRLNRVDLSSLAGIGIVIALWILGPSIDRGLIQYGATRYDRDIAAVESYYRDNGRYPATLEELVPAYLQKAPSLYMKYGEELIYDPKPEDYQGGGSFTFELRGSNLGWEGKTLKFCPAENSFCKGNERINDRWVWILTMRD